MSQNNQRICLFSNDVETMSIQQNKLTEDIIENLLNEGMPRLLGLYKKYNIRSTFFFTGHIAEKCPELILMAHAEKHEIGCHGYCHDINMAYDSLKSDDIVCYLKKAKRIIENIIDEPVFSFRAPSLRVNKDIVKELVAVGFKIDSSVASQRADMLFSFGSLKKGWWLVAPRKPYFTSKHNLYIKGDGNIFEIPISAFIVPYIGTLMRISPALTYILRYFLNLENFLSNKPIVFLIHPNEVIFENLASKNIFRRSYNYFGYLVKDKLRYHLKIKNLGEDAIKLFEKEIIFFIKRGYKFETFYEYYTKKLTRDLWAQE